MTELSTLEAAKTALKNGDFTCAVAYRGKVVFTSKARGVKPLVEFYKENGTAFQGGALADKVIGRAAALLVRLCGLGAVYSDVLSTAALEELRQGHIQVEYDKEVDYIRNRDNTGKCPMEQLSQGVTEPQQMLERIEDFFAQIAQKQ